MCMGLCVLARYTCQCMYLSVHTHATVHLCAYVMHAYTCVTMRVYSYANVCVYMYMCVYPCQCIYMLHMHMCTYAHVSVYTPECMYLCIYVCAHARICVFVCVHISDCRHL